MSISVSEQTRHLEIAPSFGVIDEQDLGLCLLKHGTVHGGFFGMGIGNTAFRMYATRAKNKLSEEVVGNCLESAWADQGESVAAQIASGHVDMKVLITAQFHSNINCIGHNRQIFSAVRYDYTSPWTERYNRISDWNFNAPSPIPAPGLNLRGGLMFPGVGRLPRSQYSADPTNFAPRVGMAYAADEKTAVRGGFGLFFAPTTGGGFNGNAVPISGFQANTPLVSTLDGVTPVKVLSIPSPTALLLPPAVQMAWPHWQGKEWWV